MAALGINPVGPSRDGHQYHEAWVARRALELLFPQDELCGIAVEGLSKEDEAGVSSAAIEVADATFYYGREPSLVAATRVEIAQFKYSVAKEAVPFRCTDAKKTIEKFVKSGPSILEIHGAPALEKVSYALYTNRPIAGDFALALAALRAGSVPTARGVLAQYTQLKALLPKAAATRRAFVERLSVHGNGGHLSKVESMNAQIIADWSSSNDVQARARLGDLRQVVRNMAGTAGHGNNVILAVDVLAALGVTNKVELLPAPDAFVDPGPVVDREQLSNFTDNLGASGRWLIHAAGGVGKTVFAQSLRSRLTASGDEVILFDCFGGGAYRSPTDNRDQPERGLMHIVNVLASRGLCDPLLPQGGDQAAVLRHALRRFQQAIDTLRRSRAGARLVLILDAADNAAIQARDAGRSPFPRLLFEALNFGEAIDGLLLIATARTERIELAMGRGKHQKFALLPFSLEETTAFVSSRAPTATTTQIGALHKRAGGNGRIIANLIEDGRAFETSRAKVTLDAVLEARIERAIEQAGLKGESEDKVAAFLCAVCVLPPPIPLAELGTAFGIGADGVQSFASDLWPLVAITRHGLIFRDEPIETLVRKIYGGKVELLGDVATKLLRVQGSSTYAARSLPSMLFAMRDTSKLRELAFDDRFPAELTGDVAKRVIRLNRVRTALKAASVDQDRGLCVELMVELSSLVMGDERGEDYLLANPDLTVGLGNNDDLRRLFEARPGGWRGTREARLAIAYTADGSLDEAYGHVVNADEWLHWIWRQGEEERRDRSPEVEDAASVAFFLLMKGRFVDAQRYLARWKPFYAYKLATAALAFCAASDAMGRTKSLASIVAQVAKGKPSPAIAAALLTVMPETADGVLRQALAGIGSRLGAKTEFPTHYGPPETDDFQRALVRCAARMVSLGLSRDAAKLLRVAAPRRIGVWRLRDEWHVEDVTDWTLYVATNAALHDREPSLFDCLPEELWNLVRRDDPPISDADQLALLEKRIAEERDRKKKATKKGERQLSSEDRYFAMDRIHERVMPLLGQCRLMSKVIRAEASKRGPIMGKLADVWKVPPKSKHGYTSREARRFHEVALRNHVSETLRAFGACPASVAQKIVDGLEASEFRPSTALIEFVRVFARREQTQAIAGRLAVICIRSIQSEEDVSSRTRLLADLARAILPTSQDEATELFARGLSELDALGSGDYDFAWELLHFATTIEDGPIPSDLVHRFAKICEMTAYESHKWPWPLTAKAFTKIGPFSYLAQICRWHDRDKVSLDYTLGSALTELVAVGRLSSGDALGLLRLTKPVRMWEWDWHHMLRAVLDDPQHSDADLVEIFAQIDASEPGRPIDSDEIDKVLAAHTQARSKLNPILDEWRDRRSIPRKVADADDRQKAGWLAAPKKRDAGKVALARRVAAVDPASSKSVEEFIEYADNLKLVPNTTRELLSGLKTRVSYPKRGNHIEALVAAANLDLFDKVELLREAKERWQGQSPGKFKHLKKAGKRLVSAHADEVLSRSWGSPASDLHKIAGLTGDPVDALAMYLAQTALEQELEPSSGAWLSLATTIAGHTPDGPAKAALVRVLSSGAARLVDHVGDGPWNKKLEPGADTDDVIAGMLWFGLASPTGADRWRAAHAVRYFATKGRWPVIDLLFAKLKRPQPGAFSDPAIPFFELNAVLWFLLTVARIAKDFPKDIEKHAKQLRRLALDADFPHVGIRQAAFEALQALQGIVVPRGALAKVNVSQLPRAAHRAGSGMPWHGGLTGGDGEPRFYFDYDFEKYRIAPVGNMFGLSVGEVETVMRTWIAKWAPSVLSHTELSGRRAPYQRGGYYRPDDDYHSHGSYLAWHALATAAGQLLGERPLLEPSYPGSDAWRDFLGRFRVSRRDGLWLADGTGRAPVEALSELRGDRGDSETAASPIDDPSFLLGLAGLTPKAVSDMVMVHADWDSPDKIDFHLSSALVPTVHSRRAALAVATGPEFHRWLPVVEHDDETWRRGDFAPCLGWIASIECSEELDSEDDSGARTAISIHKPTGSIVKDFGLQPKDPFEQTWTTNAGSVAFRYHAWGRRYGEGDRTVRENGHILSCSSSFLSKILQRTSSDLLVLVKLQKFHEKRSYGVNGKEEESKFTYGTVVAIIGADLSVSVVRPRKNDVARIERLSQYDQPDFGARYRALKPRKKPENRTVEP